MINDLAKNKLFKVRSMSLQLSELKAEDQVAKNIWEQDLKNG